MPITNKFILIITSLSLIGCYIPPRKLPEIVNELKFSCNKPVKFVFINGVFNDYQKATASTNQLSEITKTKFIVYGNNTKKWLNDLIQSYKQKESQNDINMTQRMISSLNEIIDRIDKNPDVIYSPAEKLKLDNFIKMTKRIKLFIVAHSQGNFFANEICDSASIQPEIQSFATPVSNPSKCEKNFYTFKYDPITIIGRAGNYSFKNDGFS